MWKLLGGQYKSKMLHRRGTLNRIYPDCQELSVNSLKQETEIKKLSVDIDAGPITAQPTNTLVRMTY